MLFCPFWSLTDFGPHPLLPYRKEQRAHSSKRFHFNFNYHFNWWTIPLIGCLKFNLKCVHVWRDPGIWSECVWSYAWYEHAFSACVCVCVLTEFWSFCTLKADVRETERESPDLQTHQTGHTSHTPISQYADRTMWVLCVSICEAVCVFCMSVVGPIVVYF